MSSAPPSPVPVVLHYLGYDDDRGGIVSVVRALAESGRFECILGLNRGGIQRRGNPLPQSEWPRMAGERISPVDLWRARAVAEAVSAWLRGDPRRIFHGHSRAGLLVGLRLWAMGERRVVVSVHCYGRHRWFYRRAARILGWRLFWLTPAMRRHYGIDGDGWTQCIPGAAPALAVTRTLPVPGELRLGGIGEVVPWKQWSVVVDALAALPPPARAQVRFTHIGGGESRRIEELRRRADRLGVGARVVFRGAEPDAARLLGEIDALVIASRREPCSVAMLEALAAGIPVLAADSGGAADLIRPGINGETYRTGDLAALAARLAEWIERPREWQPDRIRQSVASAREVADRWSAVYAELAARPE
jgi:glycosyltransferase involved in cell wall biosynthesis